MTKGAMVDYLNQIESNFSFLFKFIEKLLPAIIILIVGIIIARWLRKRVRKSRFGGRHVDGTLRPVIASSIFYIIISMTLYAFLTKLGIPSSALLAIFGSAGLAIGLALKDTLGNIASGVMLLMLRPVKVGEFIDTPNFSGTVKEIGLFATTLNSLDGLYIYVPNGQVWNARLTNFNRHNQRKLIIDIGVGYDSDLTLTQDLLLNVMASNTFSIDTPTPPECYVMNFGDSAIDLTCRCWMPADNWLQNSSDMRIAIKAALDKAGIDIPFPQRVVTMTSK